MDHKRRLAVVIAIASMSIGSPHGAEAQVYMSWNNCYGTVNASQSLQYACDGSRDGAPFRLALSFDQPASAESLQSVTSTIEFRSIAPQVLPDYWRVYEAGTCRAGWFPTYAPTAALVGSPVYCPNPLPGQTFAYQFAFSEDPTRLLSFQASMGTTLVPLQGGKRYSAGVVSVDPVGDLDCTGCDQAICIQVAFMDLITTATFPRGPRLHGGNPESFVTWQGPPGICPGATTTRNRTWGTVKSLYR